MIIKEIKKNIIHIIAITEKNLKFKLRFKFNLIISYIYPVIGIIMPLILMGEIFNFKKKFGPWSTDNFIIYQFIAYNLILLKSMISEFPGLFSKEKYWETLPALIIAPFRRINLVFGIFFSSLIMISVPFIFFFILSYIILPIHFLTILFIIALYFFIALIFSGIGIVIGVITISKEGYTGIINFIITFFFWFSCLSFPFYIYPEYIRNVTIYNPLYYIFDILRLSWIENNVILTITSHSLSFLIITLGAILLPLIGVYIFNKIYRKYGIVGY